MSVAKNIIDKMWQDYIEMTPLAADIVKLFEDAGESVVNDHIALRTLNHPHLTIDKIAAPFIALGYKVGGDYHFEKKKLYAKHFEHTDQSLPKIFISELLTEKFSQDFQDILTRVSKSINPDHVIKNDFTVSGKTWDVSSKDYEKLALESEYGAWLAAIGFRPNHFTVLINELNNFSEVAELNTFLKGKCIALNTSGGEVKGSPSDFLEQSSTIADTIDVKFSDKVMNIPSCYFEFAKRYSKDGELYSGFVASSADKIFESTDRQK